MRPSSIARLASCALLVAAMAACSSGGGKSAPPPPPCDGACQDATAIHGLRDMVKLAFNVTLQGKDVGPQDASAPCPLGGTVHVSGDATSNAVQGATNVDLVYTFDRCAYSEKDTDPKSTYALTVTGDVHELGVLAVQPTATTSVQFHSDALTLTGSVYAPPIEYTAADACALDLGQNGNALAGKLCGRDVGLTL